MRRASGIGASGPALASLAVLLTSCAANPITPSVGEPLGSFTAERCAALATGAGARAPVEGLVVTSAQWHPAGLALDQRGQKTAPLPAHCEINGYYGEHPGTIGGPYRTGFRMRLPQDWNKRFFFEGGGGSNGVVRDATGFNGSGNPTALERGYAVIAQDSGHDNDRNNVADHGGQLVFGFDPQARANYGHASLKPTYDLGRDFIRLAYRVDPETNIFWGCSKGGQEGMAFAQRYPEAFDGIVAMAPGMSLPRAALAEAWDTQAFARIITARGETPSMEGLKSLFSPRQFSLVSQAALAACDTLDGAQDGLIGAVGQCTTARVEPELRKRQCSAAGGGDCLSGAQIGALVTVMDGAHDSTGAQLYAPFAWDSGIGAPGWAAWKVGGQGGPPSLNVLLGGGSLAAVFTTPPTALPTDPAGLLAWQLAFDFDRDARRIYAVAPPYKTSAWQDVGMRSNDLSAFRAHGGKLIVPHGVSDPVFSVLDTIGWWKEVDRRMRGHAADFVRVFPVPGMNHCGGGPATDRFDSLSALEAWVTHGKAPAEIPATAGPDTPWPGRKTPLCPYPEIAMRDESGSYTCRAPAR